CLVFCRRVGLFSWCGRRFLSFPVGSAARRRVCSGWPSFMMGPAEPVEPVLLVMCSSCWYKSGSYFLIPHGGRLMRAESRYRQIARALRREIKEGQLQPGGQLESEKQLEERFGASRNTVRLALGMLRNQGLVISRPGRGHFVQDVVPEIFYATRTRDSASGLSEAGMPGQVLEELQLLNAGPDIASRLRVPEGTMTVVRRMHRSSGQTSVSVSIAYYPMELVQDTPLMLPENVDSALSVLMEYGHRQSGYVDELATRMPNPQEATRLELPPGVPVLEAHRTDYSEERAIRMVHTVHAGHTIRYQFEHGNLNAYHRD